MSNQEQPPVVPRKPLNNPLRGRETSRFTDHTGAPAISAYRGSRPQPDAPILPPLWSYQFYITSGATAETRPDLPLELLIAALAPLFEIFPVRIDVYFLPGADTEACIAHYRAEKAARLASGAPLPLTDPFTDGRTSGSFLVQIEYDDWAGRGATLVYFDNDSSALYGPGEEVPEAGTRVIREVGWEKDWAAGAQVPNCVGQYLDGLRDDDEVRERYEERLEGGFSDWGQG